MKDHHNLTQTHYSSLSLCNECNMPLWKTLSSNWSRTFQHWPNLFIEKFIGWQASSWCLCVVYVDGIKMAFKNCGEDNLSFGWSFLWMFCDKYLSDNRYNNMSCWLPTISSHWLHWTVFTFVIHDKELSVHKLIRQMWKSSSNDATS